MYHWYSFWCQNSRLSQVSNSRINLFHIRLKFNFTAMVSKFKNSHPIPYFSFLVFAIPLFSIHCFQFHCIDCRVWALSQYGRRARFIKIKTSSADLSNVNLQLCILMEEFSRKNEGQDNSFRKWKCFGHLGPWSHQC